MTTAGPSPARPGAGFAERYGPRAVVLGAGEGIGAAFADHLAQLGLQLVLVDRDPEALEATGREVADRHGVEVESVVADLADLDQLVGVASRAAADDIGLVVCNAAVSAVGPFLDQPIDVSLAQLDVNCRAPLVVAHHVLPALRRRGGGGLIVLSSMSAMRGAPLVTTYAATKAFDLVLAEGLWQEVRGDGVDVLAVLPGQTRTPGMLRSNPTADPATMMDPSDVVREALAALGAEPSIIVGDANRAGEAALAAMGRRDAVSLMGRVMADLYPQSAPTAAS